MAGKGGGAWKVAYADFATAMMAFFLVMWITAQGKPIKQAISNYFEDPNGVRKGVTSSTPDGDHEAVIEGNKEVGRGPAKGLAMAEGDSQSRSKAKGVDARLPPDMRIEREYTTSFSQSAGVQFQGSSHQLEKVSESELADFVQQARGKPQKVQILAFPPTGSFRSTPGGLEKQLNCFQQARIVQETLTAQGIEPQRIQICVMDGEILPDPSAYRTQKGRPAILVTMTDVVVHQ